MMTDEDRLLDQFALAALQGMLASGDVRREDAKDWAYPIAQEMLVKRAEHKYRRGLSLVEDSDDVAGAIEVGRDD